MMTNKLLSPTKMMAGLTILATILGTTRESLAQNLASNGNNKIQSSINTVSSISPTDFAVANVGKYYPDMVDYTKKMMNSFRNQEQKEAVNKILAGIIKKYTNPQEKIRFIIGTLEGDAINTGSTKFSDLYWTDPTKEDMQFYEEFQTLYKVRFDAYEKQFNANLANLQKEIKNIENEINQTKDEINQTKNEINQTKGKINQNIVNISNIMNNFSKEDVLKDKNLYNLVKEFKEKSTKYGRTTTSHTKELFSIIK